MLEIILAAALVQDSIDDLVRRLGDDRPDVRDRATAALIARGPEIESALRKLAPQAEDLEVRSRLNAIVRDLARERIARAGTLTYYGHFGTQFQTIVCRLDGRDAKTDKDEPKPPAAPDPSWGKLKPCEDVGGGFWLAETSGTIALYEKESGGSWAQVPGSASLHDLDVKGWSPDGRFLAMVGLRWEEPKEGTLCRDIRPLLMLDAKTKTIKEEFVPKATNKDADSVCLSAFEWSPTSSRLLFQQDDVNSG